MQTKLTLKEKVLSEATLNWGNNYKDNWDTFLFGEEYGIKRSLKGKIDKMAKVYLPGKIYQSLVFDFRFKNHIAGLTQMYEKLEANYSKELLVKILTFRVLGHKKYKLPLSDKKYWDDLKLAESLIIDKESVIDPKFQDFLLYIHDLKRIGIDLKLYLTSLGVLIDFIIKQYVYGQEGVEIKVVENDVVIDAGACWGDTALFFAHETGPGGKVYSFEFIPSNLEILKKNLDLNPHLKPRIEIIPHPLWSESEINLYYNNFGPASRVSMQKFEGSEGSAKTFTIDKLVQTKKLEKVDFIKMDIEGAEPYCLEGARETIIRFKPKLAIAVYHNLSDFYTIVNYIDNLNLGYKFYLQHATIHEGETVVFAQV